MDNEKLLAALKTLEPQISVRENADRLAVTVPCERLGAFMSKLKLENALRFDILYAHTAIDWVAENRFELIYILSSLEHGHSLMVCVSIPRDTPVAPSVSSIWRIAEWQEREVYDMFGVLYRDHPDLRRLLLEDDWQGFPLRKDYKDDFMLEKPQ